MSGAVCAFRNGLAVAVRLIRHRLTPASLSLAAGIATSPQFNSAQVLLGHESSFACHRETPSPSFSGSISLQFLYISIPFVIERGFIPSGLSAERAR